MLQGWVVIAVALGYIGLLFVVASYGDRARRFRPEGRSRHLIYPLSLAIYCTSWTFFGSVGLATRTGFEFLTIYIGPVIMIGLCYPFIMRVVRLAKAQNITSIADFTAARYGKSQAVAATVALIAIISTIPYIALQLKAVSGSLGTIIGDVRPDIAANMPDDQLLGLVRTAADFYRLEPERLLELEGYGQVSVERLLGSIKPPHASARSGSCCSRSGSRASAT